MDGARPKAPHTLRLAPVGTCIYCGTIGVNLTDEHIIPKGLGGTLVLPESSCEACAKLTSQVEMRVLRGFMDRGRHALGIKGRKAHKRVRPATVPMTLIHPDETLAEADIPLHVAMHVMHMPVFVLPAFLNPQRPPSPTANDVEVFAIDTLTFGVGQSEVLREHSARGVRFQDRLDIWAFVRMLAKIAHGHHVAIHGMFPLEESPLVPIILGTRSDAKNWIGCTEQDPLPSDRTSMHLLQDIPLEGEDGSKGMAVRIKLFAPHNAPTYALATRLPLAPLENA